MPQSALFTGIIPPVSTIFTAAGQLDQRGGTRFIELAIGGKKG
ncbi:dihydrodipicolinate synthase family protein, partial [Bacillus halotolerans]